MIRELAKKLATFSEFADFVIIELNFQRGNFEPSAQILKSHSSMVLLRASSKDAEILVKMIRPRREVTASVGCRIQAAEKCWKIFTASEISEFATAVGDKNKIHQLNPPIVPAFLILEKIDAEFPTNFIKLRFKNFITAGEPLSLSVDENRFEITCAGDKKVLGEFL